MKKIALFKELSIIILILTYIYKNIVIKYKCCLN